VCNADIEKPLLVFGRKVSVRLYVLLMDTGECYIHRRGAAFLAPAPFVAVPPGSPDKRERSHVNKSHVTTMCHQHEADTEDVPVTYMRLDELQRHIDEHKGDAFPPQALHRMVLPVMKKAIQEAIRGAPEYYGPIRLAAASRRSPERKDEREFVVTGATGINTRRWFEVLGADFVLDEDLRPWFLGFAENILSPTHSPEHEAMLEEMCGTVLRLAVDPLFPATPQLATSGLRSIDLDAGTGAGVASPSELTKTASILQTYVDMSASICTGYSSIEGGSIIMDPSGLFESIVVNVGQLSDHILSLPRAHIKVPSFAWCGPKIPAVRMAWFANKMREESLERSKHKVAVEERGSPTRRAVPEERMQAVPFMFAEHALLSVAIGPHSTPTRASRQRPVTTRSGSRPSTSQARPSAPDVRPATTQPRPNTSQTGPSHMRATGTARVSPTRSSLVTPKKLETHVNKLVHTHKKNKTLDSSSKKLIGMNLVGSVGSVESLLEEIVAGEDVRPSTTGGEKQRRAGQQEKTASWCTCYPACSNCCPLHNPQRRMRKRLQQNQKKCVLSLPHVFLLHPPPIHHCPPNYILHPLQLQSYKRTLRISWHKRMQLT
jgi:hypothetical protein